MNKKYPTREEVELWKCESAHSPLHDHAFENHNRLICLADAYLAQEEELDEVNDRRMELVAMVEQLKVENKALKEALTKILGWRERDRESLGEIILYMEELASQALEENQP